MDYQLNFKNKGFSLAETLVVLTIIIIFSSISFFTYYSARENNNLDLIAFEVIEGLRRAQTNARAMREDSFWGVKINEDQIVIFKGNNYENRDIEFDQIINTSSNISITGLDEIVFEKLTGFTSDVGFFTLSNKNTEKNIEINELGIIFY